jgi:endonuclease-3 related protein
MNNSFELLQALKKITFENPSKELLWWPNSGSFEVLVGAILTQQTKWEKVEQSLENLKNAKKLELDKIAQIDILELATLIKPSGFYNTKAKNLKQLCQNIYERFGDFENFVLHVSRDWLLEQKGLGPESVDCILCYACKREIMVVDSYTNRLLAAYGYEFESYDALQEWCMRGIEENFDKVLELYVNPVDLNVIYARFHGKIVEFCKENMRGKKVNLESLDLN